MASQLDGGICYVPQTTSGIGNGNFEIYRINADGSDKTRLTNSPSSDGLPVWSPDGKWIAFRSDRGGWAIYAMRSDGSDLHKIVDAPVLPVWFLRENGLATIGGRWIGGRNSKIRGQRSEVRGSGFRSLVAQRRGRQLTYAPGRRKTEYQKE